MKHALFPISADPLTYGHLNIIEKALDLCEESLTIVILENNQKKTWLSLDQRKQLVHDVVQSHFQAHEDPQLAKASKKLRVDSWAGMLHEFILQEGIFNVVRGIRNPEDLTYERALRNGYQAQLTATDMKLQFIYLLCDEPFQDISSSLAKSILLQGGEINRFVPIQVKQCLEVTQLKQHKLIVTGSIGSGKSTVIPLLMDQLAQVSFEAHHINMDTLVAHLYKTLENGGLTVLAKKLLGHFQIKPPISQQIIRELIFNSTTAQAQHHLKFLEQTLAPYIKNEYRNQLRGKRGIIFIEAPQAAEYHLIYESNGRVLFINCEATERQNRLMQQRNLKIEEVAKRMKVSASPDEKLLSIEKQITALKTGKIFTYDNTAKHDFTALATLIKKLIEEFNL